MYYLFNAYISVNMRTSAPLKLLLWSTNTGNDSWTVNRRQGRQQGTKPASSKIANCSYSSSYFCQKVYSTIAHLWS